MTKEEFIDLKMKLSKEDIIYDYYATEEKLIEKLGIEHENYELKQENKQLKECYCNRTDCSGRIKNSREYDSLYQKYNKQLDNWNKLKEYLINDINDRNGTKIAEFEEGNRVSETISPIYTLMEDKSRTMKEVLDKMQELEQGSDSND